MTPSPLSRFRWPVFLLGALLLAGCTIPTPGYRKVDQSLPEFREAVAREAERFVARGFSVIEAQENATRIVTDRMIQAQKVDRPRQVQPLLAAVKAFDQPRGCWAYTVTTTTRTNGVAKVLVEQFDAFQPEAKLWTLVSRDGRTPDEKEQAEYREKKIRQWKARATRGPSRRMDPERLQKDAIYAEFSMAPADGGRKTEYVFVRGKMAIPVLGTLNGMRHTYLVDNASGALLGMTEWTGPDSILLGMRAVHFDTVTDYAVLEPGIPPFLTRAVARYRFILATGRDTGEVEREVVYSDYRRVKCFDDRFEVRIGVPEIQDFLPDGG